jgi:hypothetical protein
VLRAEPDAIKLGMRCIGFEPSDNGAIAAFENGERVRGNVLIGAEIHSIVRQRLFGADKTEFTPPHRPPGQSLSAISPFGFTRDERVNWLSLSALKGRRDYAAGSFDPSACSSRIRRTSSGLRARAMPHSVAMP